MRLIDEQFMETLFYGTRQMPRHLPRLGQAVGRKRVRLLMRRMGLAAVYRKPRTSVPHPGHAVFPYLLRELTIDRTNQVWCADITYIPMRRGFLYLVAVMDWATRKRPRSPRRARQFWSARFWKPRIGASWIYSIICLATHRKTRVSRPRLDTTPSPCQ